jgi:POT family proton-dependent oligopeptide transporter
MAEPAPEEAPTVAPKTATLEPFPPTFYYANAIELFERLAHYGMYVGLALYLTNVVGYGDVAVGGLLGNFRFVASLAPVPCGAIADRITFKRSLILAFCLYALGYVGLFAYPTKALAPLSLLFLAVGGGFMKPVITGTVVRTAPPGRQVEGFAVFYRMINAGSVVGKSLAYLVRVLVTLRYVMITSVFASVAALALAVFGYTEPERGAAKKSSFLDTLRGYGGALKNLRFSLFLVLFAGFYFMAEQFYMTFPKYVTRHIDAKAPLEIITLINPALIAVGQGFISRRMKGFHPLTTMVFGVLLASLSMLVMGSLPTLVGACLSGAIFACAEMTFSPRFYAYIASFAPPGKEGMYMGLAFVPAAIGAWIGGQVSGHMIQQYLPAEGARSPFTVWSTYAALGLGCALLMLVYRWFAVSSDKDSAPPVAPA